MMCSDETVVENVCMCVGGIMRGKCACYWHTSIACNTWVMCTDSVELAYRVQENHQTTQQHLALHSHVSTLGCTFTSDILPLFHDTQDQANKRGKEFRKEKKKKAELSVRDILYTGAGMLKVISLGWDEECKCQSVQDCKVRGWLEIDERASLGRVWKRRKGCMELVY